MDRHFILERLNLAPSSRMFFIGLDLQQWGRELHFQCDADGMLFTVIFKDCREMKWQLYTHLSDDTHRAFPRGEWVNFRMGRDQHRSPAHILSDYFGLSLVYGALDVVKTA